MILTLYVFHLVFPTYISISEALDLTKGHCVYMHIFFSFKEFYAQFLTHKGTGKKKSKNKRSKDIGALLDSCSWDDIGNFLQTCIKKYKKFTVTD